jgi:predicted metal-dependent RNase
MHIDFEGRSDGESIIKLIESMKPKRTIVVRGSSESCQALQNLCLSTGKIDFEVENEYANLNSLIFLLLRIIW